MTVESDLIQSIKEEGQAIRDYGHRGVAARKEGDVKTAARYKEIARDETTHKTELGSRLSEVGDMTKREKKLKACVLDLLDGKPMPKGQGQKARYERCVLKVKCQNKIEGHPKRVNPWAVCHASVG